MLGSNARTTLTRQRTGQAARKGRLSGVAIYSGLVFRSIFFVAYLLYSCAINRKFLLEIREIRGLMTLLSERVMA
jgi:hypothetical protein